MLNTQAIELNEKISRTNASVLEMLSEKGKAIFYPAKGILAQTAEARGKHINATIGTALEDNGDPMNLDSINRHVSLEGPKGFSYAPSTGRPEIRKLWKEMLFKKNPSLSGISFSTPVVTSALTHGLSMAGYLFVDEGDTVITPDLYWENYNLVIKQAYGARFSTYPAFNDFNGFNTDGLKSELLDSPVSKKIVILNFPNNPTGYTVTAQEAEEIKKILVEAAQRGNNLVVLIDDAYFGLVFEDGIMKESIFSLLADAHEKILAVKLDGPTKEDYVWGFRVGFVTFGSALNSPELYYALERKLGGAIRGSISSASNLGQSLLLAAYNSDSYEQEKKVKFSILQKRFFKIREILNHHPEYLEHLQPLPFNSGYFMCVKVKKGNTDEIRKILLEKYDTGVIAQGNLLRIAFSSTPYGLLEKLFENVYQAAKEI
ncbi:MAG: aminotransferase class I/II-fold pyridoxal phosphate-dependent enzyme [Chitinispirillaceae bacterium]